jgi:hypothetical protein
VKFLIFLEHLRFEFQKINACKFTEMINKRHIVFFLPIDSGAGPLTSEYRSSSENLEVLKELEEGN